MDLTTKVQLITLDEVQYKKVRLYEITKEMIGEKVTFFGWVTKSHGLKKVSFCDITSYLTTVKCVLNGDVKYPFQTSVIIYGEVVKNAGRDGHEFEILVNKHTPYNGMITPTYPVSIDSENKVLFDQGHLAMRLSERSLNVSCVDELLTCLRTFFKSKKCIEVIPPTLVQNQVEGGATLFKLDYYGKEAYLTQSSQLYLETVAPAVGACYCIMPSFRAEKSNTPRHLSEFTHVEAEIVDFTFDGLMQFVESMIKFVCEKFYESKKDDIIKVYPNFKFQYISNEPFKRVPYRKAIDFLIEKKHCKPSGKPYEQGDDIADGSEKFLCAEMANGQPMFLTEFLACHKPFYTKKCSHDSSLVEACDLLLPDLGETVGCSMRSDVYDELIEGLKAEGLSVEDYYWYVDLAKYGPSPHGGFGLGLERLMTWLMKYSAVTQATLYPRTPSRCKP